MRWLTLLLLIAGGDCFGQLAETSLPENRTMADRPVASQPQPGCDAYTMDNLPTLGVKRKACYYRDRLLTGSAVF